MLDISLGRDRQLRQAELDASHLGELRQGGEVGGRWHVGVWRIVLQDLRRIFLALLVALENLHSNTVSNAQEPSITLLGGARDSANLLHRCALAKIWLCLSCYVAHIGGLLAHMAQDILVGASRFLVGKASLSDSAELEW